MPSPIWNTISCLLPSSHLLLSLTLAKNSQYNSPLSLFPRWCRNHSHLCGCVIHPTVALKCLMALLRHSQVPPGERFGLYCELCTPCFFCTFLFWSSACLVTAVIFESLLPLLLAVFLPTTNVLPSPRSSCVSLRVFLHPPHPFLFSFHACTNMVLIAPFYRAYWEEQLRIAFWFWFPFSKVCKLLPKWMFASWPTSFPLPSESLSYVSGHCTVSQESKGISPVHTCLCVSVKHTR